MLRFEKSILLTDNIQNTDQEAKSVKKLLNQNNKIILVTSAFHMPRAKKIFKAVDIDFCCQTALESGEYDFMTPMKFLA